MTTAEAIKWETAGKAGSSQTQVAYVDGKRLSVSRTVVKRSRSHKSRFGFVSYRVYYSTTLVEPGVRVGDTIYRLPTCYSVRDAKAAAVRFALTGEGEVRETIAVDWE